MNPGGDRPQPILVEQPRRSPWLLVAVILAAGVVAGWVLIGLLARLAPPEAPEPQQRSIPSKAYEVPPPPLQVRVPEGAPRWETAPVPQFPASGVSQGSGVVQLNCVVQADRTLGDCRITNETPEGYGFGRSAIEAATRSTVDTDSVVGQRVAFTVRYRLADR